MANREVPSVEAYSAVDCIDCWRQQEFEKLDRLVGQDFEDSCSSWLVVVNLDSAIAPQSDKLAAWDSSNLAYFDTASESHSSDTLA